MFIYSRHDSNLKLHDTAHRVQKKNERRRQKMEAASINHVEVDSGGENKRENNVAEEWTSDNILWRLKQQSPKPSSQRSRSANGNHNAHYINIILIKIKISVCCCRYLHSSRASPSLAAGSTSAVLFSNESEESQASTATVVQCFLFFWHGAEQQYAFGVPFRPCGASRLWYASQ